VKMKPYDEGGTDRARPRLGEVAASGRRLEVILSKHGLDALRDLRTLQAELKWAQAMEGDYKTKLNRLRYQARKNRKAVAAYLKSGT
jgi:hypothetical protein